MTDINIVYIVVGTRGYASDREFFVATWRRSREEAEEVVLRLKREAALLKEWNEEYRRLYPIATDAALMNLWCEDYSSVASAPPPEEYTLPPEHDHTRRSAELRRARVRPRACRHRRLVVH